MAQASSAAAKRTDQTLLYRLARSGIGMKMRLASRVGAKIALAPVRGLSPLRRRLHLPANGLAGLPGTPGGAVGEYHALDPSYREVWPRPILLPGVPVPPLFATDRVIETEPTGVLILPRARFWGHYSGAIFDAEDRLVGPVSRDPWSQARHTVYTRWKLPPIVDWPGRTLVLATPEAENNYHHWMIDLIPRIDLVRRAGYTLDSFDRIVVNHRGSRYQLETLATLGLPKEKLVRLSPALHARAELLVTPTLVPDNTRISRRAVVAVRRLGEGVAATSSLPRRVYLSRKDAGFRRVSNDDEVLATLATDGFEAVEMSKLTVAAQIALMQGAEIVAGPAGANLANIVFMNPGAKVLELMPPGWVHPYNWGLAAGAGLAFYVHVSGGQGYERTIEGRYQDFAVDCAELRAMLDHLHA